MHNAWGLKGSARYADFDAALLPGPFGRLAGWSVSFYTDYFSNTNKTTFYRKLCHLNSANTMNANSKGTIFQICAYSVCRSSGSPKPRGEKFSNKL